MAQNIDSPMLVRQIARLIRKFNEEQVSLLLELAPNLQSARDRKKTISAEQTDLAGYYDSQLEALTEYPPMQDDDMFVGGLTVGEFFALPEPEQDRIWHKAHLETAEILKDYEHPIQPDALPAR
jgi:hypothetical protein